MATTSRKQRNTFRPSKVTKILAATAVTISAMPVAGFVGPIDKAEASTTYYWSKYSVSSDYVLLENLGYAVSSETIQQRLAYWQNIHPTAHTMSHSGGTDIGYYKQGKGNYIGEVSSSSSNAYPYGGYKDGNYYEFNRSVTPNRAPNTPTLTLPTNKFEHGDKHYIGWDGTDPDGDSLTYKLQASYNGGAWEDLYSGPNKSYQYTIPSNKGSNVKFRVIANDSKLTSTSAESAPKDITEVMYYWNKFNNTQVGGGYSSWQFDSQESAGNTKYTNNSSTPPYEVIKTWTGANESQWEQRLVWHSGSYVPSMGQYIWSAKTENYKKVKMPLQDVKGSLAQGNIQAGLNAYITGTRNSDGYWYERGQRVNAADTTPPIIELSEQSVISSSSVVTVKTFDLGTVAKVKWAKGDQSITYFSSGGTQIGNGQTSSTSFTASSNGVYTVYAEDNLGNKAVKTITVTKVNTAPTTPVLTIPNDKFEHGDKHFFGVNSSDADGQELTYTIQASYNNGAWEDIYKGKEKTYEYTVPNNKGTSVKFRALVTDGVGTVTGTESTPKEISEVMYYWNKFEMKDVPIGGYELKFVADNTSEGQEPWRFHSVYSKSYGFDSVTGKLTKVDTYTNTDVMPVGQKFYLVQGDTLFHYTVISNDPTNGYKAKSNISRSTPKTGKQKSLVTANIKAGASAYVHGAVHTDGYIYERAQRIIGDDTTPPIITLTEPTDYSAVTNVTVKTHDLSTVTKVKWAQGEKDLAYFATGGTDINTGQVTPSSFIASDNGMYTVYAEDSKGNKAVQTIMVTKANTPPTEPILDIPDVTFEHDDEHFISVQSTDLQNQEITYTVTAEYNDGTSDVVHQGVGTTFKYRVPNDKTSVVFKAIASDGILDSSETVSTPKSIGEVTYIWSKFNNAISYVNVPVDGWEYLREGSYNSHIIGGDVMLPYVPGDPIVKAIPGTSHTAIATNGNKYVFTFGPKTQQPGGYELTGLFYKIYKPAKVMQPTPINVKGSLVKNDIKAGYSEYNHGVRNPDGFWYERGQRVIGDDVTPPIIEVTEQTSYGPTSVMKVKTHDLSKVSKVKWAKGNQTVDYFETQGAEIGTGQDVESSFAVDTNGEYTVFAVDDKGNKGVKVVTAKMINSAPTIKSVTPVDKYNVMDDNINFTISVGAEDLDGQDLSSKVKYGNGGTASSPNTQLVLQGLHYDKGFHTSPILVTVHDGIVDSNEFNYDGHIVIKVNDAADYTRLLKLHTNAPNDLTETEHKAFYDSYEAVLGYEQSRASGDYTKAFDAINNIGTETEATKEWHERIHLVLTTVALEEAESSLDRNDFEEVIKLHNDLKLDSNKTSLQARVDELTKYHDASDLLVPMETEVERHKANSTSALDTAIINTANFANARTSIALTSDKSEASYNTVLTQRLKDLQDYYLNNKDGLTTDDIADLYPDLIDPDITTEYDEIKDAFQPLSENLEHLIKYTNALVNFLRNVDQVSKDDYISVTQALPRDTGIDFAELDKVTTAVQSIYTYRSTFKEDHTALSQILTDIGVISIGGVNTTGYMVEIQKAMKEVTEYNDIDLDAEHDETEKQEAVVQVGKLKPNSKFQLDMTEYLENGIPISIIDADPYEYIVNGDVIIKGSVTDTNHTQHTVTAAIGSDEATGTTSNGLFELTINKLEGVYLNEAITVNVNDGLTNKAITIKDKPVISVSNPELYKEMLKFLEEDRSEIITAMTSQTLEELLDIFNKTTSITLDSSPILVQGLYNQAERLSTQNEGKLETFIRNYVQSNYLDWLFQNYLTATVDDFTFVGVTRDGKAMVTYENIDSLRATITDYKNSYAPDTPPTPAIQDYLNWIDMLNSFDELDAMIENIYTLTTSDTVTIAVQEATDKIDTTIPTWSSYRAGYDTKIIEVKAYHSAVLAVEIAEGDYTQVSHQLASDKLPTVVNNAARQALQERLDEVQRVIHAIAAVEVAEASKDETDIQNAQVLVDALKDGPKKTELLERLADVSNYDAARKAVVVAEKDLTQDAHDDAKTLVDALTDGQLKSDLLERLEEVQRIIKATKGVTDAETTASDEDIKKAQDLIDLVITEPIKTDLQNRLDDVKDYADAVKSVVDAETNLDQPSKDLAQGKVDVLPPSDSKDRLQDRLDDVQQIINAGKAVDTAGDSLNRDDVLIAQGEIDKVINVEEKEKLQERLDDIIKIIEAIEATEKAEGTKTQGDKDDAFDLVSKLPDSAIKDELLDRLDKVQDDIDKKSAEDKADDAVSKAEDTWDDQDILDAQDAIDKVTDPIIKEELQDRLDKVTDLLVEYERVKALVEQAEVSKGQDDVDIAQKGIDDLIVLAGKLNSKIEELQSRLDEVNRYIEAEKAVTLVEGSKFKRHFDIAQILVDDLKPGVDQDYLQERLDAIKSEITDKEDSLIDQIVNGDSGITGQDVADFTGETAYDELVKDYIDAAKDLADKTGSLTKEDLIKIVRTVNALELAKRSMNKTHISTYQVELDTLNTAIRSNFPEPSVMFGTADYLAGQAEQEELAKSLAELLGRDVNLVMKELEDLLAGIDDVTSGFYSVQYIDIDTQQVLINEPIEAQFGLIEYTPSIDLKDYELIDTDPVSFELNKDTNGQVFKFFVKSTKADTTTGDSVDVEVKPGIYNVVYVTADNTIITHTTTDNLELGTHEVRPEEIPGYQLVVDEELVKYVDLTADMPEQEVVFRVEAIPGWVPNPNPKSEGMEVFTGEVQPVEVFNEGIQTLEFIEPEMQPTEPVEENRIYLGHTGQSRQVTVSGESSDRPTLLPETGLEGEPHQQYLYQSVQALMMVGAYVQNPTEKNLDAAIGFVSKKLLDGAYKSNLLTLLNAESGNFDEDGEPDLTPRYPYVPPVITPPTPPTEVVPPPVDNGGGSYEPPTTSIPWTPIIVPDGGTEATKEVIHDVVVDKDGSHTWVIENPLKDGYELTSEDVNVNIKFGKDKLNGVSKLEIKWKHLGKEHYQLIVIADGKEIKEFDAEISKKHKFGYMHLKTDKGYKATPYNYKNGKFNFKTKGPKTFFFIDKKRTFTDISKYTTEKSSIEEMASRLIVQGSTPDKFKPNGNATRAHFAAILTRAMGLVASDKDTPFTDTKGQWHEKEVQALYETGVIYGTSKTTFNPNAYINREQTALMLYRVLKNAEANGTLLTADGKLPTVTTADFKDSKHIAKNAQTAVATLQALGLVEGVNGDFKPKQKLTRSQLTKLISGTLKLTGDM